MKYHIDAIICSDRPGPGGELDIEVIDHLATFETRQEAVGFALQMQCAAQIADDTEEQLDAEILAMISGVRP